MGRAMLIICAAALIGLGIVGLGTANQGNLLTEKSAEYANEMTAKNAAHTAVQMAMQNINKDPDWVKNHDSEAEAWVEPDISGAKTTLYLEPLNDTENNDYWKVDSLRMVSKAEVYEESDNPFEATVTSLYLKEPFSTLVPPFGGAVQLPTGYGNLDTKGNSHSISGNDQDCGESKPPITVHSQTTKDDIENEGVNFDGEVEVDTTLNYQPTDELVKRLENSNNATTIGTAGQKTTYGGSLGTADEPGVFFVEGEVKLTGGADEGFGILVVKNEAFMEYQHPDSTNSVSIGGNFTFNGLIIFENADAFKSGGTPDVNGSVLVGDTNLEDDTDIDITFSGNSSIKYSCKGEDYAKMAASNTVAQNKYTRIVTFEETGFSSD